MPPIHKSPVITYGSIFTGAGGFDLGLDAAGWECKWQIESNPRCQQVLGYRWPNTDKHIDVQGVAGSSLKPVDAVVFGSPCQDLSVAGAREGLAGSQSKLFFEATRIIGEMQDATGKSFPRWVIWENVPGSFTSRNGDDFEAVIKEMVNLGSHHIEWHCVDAQFFGVPQRRRRVFLIACFDPSIGKRGGKEILSVSEGRRKNLRKSEPQRKETPPIITASFGESGFGWWAEDSLASSIAAQYYKSPHTLIAYDVVF